MHCVIVINYYKVTNSVTSTYFVSVCLSLTPLHKVGTPLLKIRVLLYITTREVHAQKIIHLKLLNDVKCPFGGYFEFRCA